MIELKIEEYCQNCPDFEAKVTVKENELFTMESPTPCERYCNTIVACAHAKRCEGIKRYLQQQGKDCKKED